MKNILLVCSLLTITASIQSQNILNLKASSTDDYMVIAYDLQGEADVLYKVSLHFLQEDSTKIFPKALNGDVGKVEAGSGKTIVWNVYKDIDGISGNLEPILVAKKIVPKDIVKNKQDKPTPNAPGKILDVLTTQIGKSNKKEKKKVRVGIKGGIGTSNVTPDARVYSFTENRSFMVGPTLRWNISKRFYLQPEVLYHQGFYGEVISPDKKIIHRHQYGKAQLLAGISPFGFVHFNAGLYYGKLLKGIKYDELEIIGPDNAVNLAPIEINEFPFSDEDLGYTTGLSFSFGQGSFSFGWLYSRSFNSFVEGDYYVGDQLVSTLSLKNSSSHFFIQKAF